MQPEALSPPWQEVNTSAAIDEMRRICAPQPHAGQPAGASDNSSSAALDTAAFEQFAVNPEDPAVLGRLGRGGGAQAGGQRAEWAGKEAGCVPHDPAVLAFPLRSFFPLPGCVGRAHDATENRCGVDCLPRAPRVEGLQSRRPAACP